MAFKFKLENVYNYRRQLEEQAMQNLSKAILARQNEEERLLQLRESLLEQQAAMAGNIEMSGAERWLVQSYIKALQVDIEFSVRQLEIMKEEESRCQVALVEKAQERKLLEKLKSKQQERYNLQEKLKEQNQNDETATIRYGKQAI